MIKSSSTLKGVFDSAQRVDVLHESVVFFYFVSRLHPFPEKLFQSDVDVDFICVVQKVSPVVNICHLASPSKQDLFFFIWFLKFHFLFV